MSMQFDKESLRRIVIDNIKENTGKNPQEASLEEIYRAISGAMMVYITDSWVDTKRASQESHQKEVAYISAEFLMGRSLGNNLINFGINETITELLEEFGLDMNLIEKQEPDPGLGNGGLGRLAACFLDSMATLKIIGQGYGIRYKYGMFAQKIENGYQIEKPDSWSEEMDPWEIRRDNASVMVKFGGYVDNFIGETGRVEFRLEDAETVIAVPYDMPIVGFKNKHINTLRLWKAKAPEPFDIVAFNQGDYQKAVANQNAADNISRVLYPNDNSLSGKELRLRQEYFLCSATMQDIINKFVYQYGEDSWHLLPEKFAVQLNDTHPVVAIPELMRILLDEKHIDWCAAWEMCTRIFNYTNHTVLTEALETWNIDMFRTLLPRIYQIIEEINRRFLRDIHEKYPEAPELADSLSILSHGVVHMAHLAIIGSQKINGVAQLHTEIIKSDTLKDWYLIYPEKFTNKTNGITPRRWLIKSNPLLTSAINKKIGDSWQHNLDDLKKLLAFEDDEEFLNELLDIKDENKIDLTAYIKEWTGIDIDHNSIFDVQVKRLHEYKRQLLNVLHIIYLYQEIQLNPNLDIHPRTFIFAAKAASGYRMAKLIIKLINNVANVVNNNPYTNKKLKVVFIPNYQVSIAEHIFPAADVSEQISTAGKEASGTGNMKFMANGAITLGTLDGANIEILEEVGDDNCVIFGATADEIKELDESGTYHAIDYYQRDPQLRKVLDSLIDQSFTFGENPYLFQEIFDSLIHGIEGNHADRYYLLKDFESYIKAQKEIDKLYRDRKKWAKIMLHNIAKCGKFSSDRTIKEYAEEIWGVEALHE
ncbi:MAG: glycogen/starch/alpha-glucan phosphorylase [Brevinema sp.]